MTFWQKWNRKESGKRKTIPSWLAGFGLGVLFLVIGFLDGQLTDIFRKAVMICLECIGIG